FIILNHAGDVMSANMAMDMLENDGLADKVKIINTHEDIAPGVDTPIEDRRGLVGCVGVYKVAGAAAEAGKSLDEVFAVADKFNNQMATLAVALKTATHPSTGGAIFELAADEMEIGMGQHGEAGTGRSAMLSADKTAEVMATQLIKAVGATEGDSVLVMINGAGATTLMEMFIVFRGIKTYLDTLGIKIGASCVGEYLTVQEMGGFQMFIAKLDDELQAAWDAPADTAYMTVR
ncbi:MAG: glycerol kinase, partial [Phycisphaerales bacterium]|nr:glycerol kinase [Phycisphaerales bacterium]